MECFIQINKLIIPYSNIIRGTSVISDLTIQNTSSRNYILILLEESPSTKSLIEVFERRL